MIVRLNSDYVLRGWKGASCALVRLSASQVRFCKPDEFSLLLLANGVNDIDEGVFTDGQLESLRKLVDEGILQVCSEPSPLDSVQTYKLYDNRFVSEVLWSVTGHCNCRCRHCYMDAPAGALGEISHEEAISFIDQMAECGVLQVMLTGGEPLVRPDFRELVAHLTRRGIKISQIYTNGLLLDEDILDYLDRLGQKPDFSFSFDGLGWHDWMRGVAGTEDAVLRGIRLCQEKGFGASVEACLHKGSVGSLRETVKLLGGMNIRIKVGSVMDTELWRANSEGNGFSDDEYFAAMLDYIPRFFEDGMPADLTLGAVVRLHKGSTEYRVIADKMDGSEACLERHMCGAARMTAYITPDGRLLPCMPMTAWVGHTCFKRIQDIGLKEGLTDGFYMSFVNGKIKDLLERNEKCNACEYRLRCGGGCRACALADEGDLYGADHLQCLYWKNGYVDKIRAVTEAAIGRYCS